MASAAELVRVAASQIGTKESPAGSNRVKYGKWYGLDGNPWCDMFVSWCANQIGASGIVGKYAYCPSHVNYFKNKGWWLGRDCTPKPGDVIFFSNGKRACHVGIVEKRINSNTVQTIEGNTSVSNNDNGGKVMRRTRSYGTVGSKWYVLGFGRPVYPSDKSSGSSSVKSVQKWCNEKYDTGLKEDGEYGVKTKRGLVKALQSELNRQRDAGLKVDGKFGAKTKAACVAVKKGSQGNITRVLQGALICRGYDPKGFDGKFGSGTEKAVEAFQKACGLSSDGVAGKNTFEALLG